MEIFLELPGCVLRQMCPFICSKKGRIEGKMDSTEFKIFIEDYFNIRRKERVCSGMAPDMMIEQCLIKSMKVEGTSCAIRDTIGPIKDALICLHVAAECDTISAIFRKGKFTALHLMTKNHKMPSLVLQFNSPQLDPWKVNDIGDISVTIRQEGSKTLYSKFTLATLPLSTAASQPFFFKSDF
ncbi:hypothetical protein AVEN_211551-1 [Araneus ventricosus]|uniref:Uncharacterized protein n=1 Tax=Araneus ventricosus TaxID=182803 RepID=A0A4Y2D8Z4_ARAVE|nr:hypothetical protein AVEN_211551-1 [Araneus ventricosus]